MNRDPRIAKHRLWSRCCDSQVVARFSQCFDVIVILLDTFKLQIDVDEKLFYAWSSRGKLKMPAGDEAPKSALQSQRYIPKVMMLAAIGRPSGRVFDGKVGMWPIGELRAAKRGDSRTGLRRGDMVWESATLDAERWVRMLVHDVFPAIRAKLPRARVVKVQFDNAPGHRTKNIDTRITAALTSARPHIKLVNQPAQSPCTNLCDLGFFNSIDSKLPKLRSFRLPETTNCVRMARPCCARWRSVSSRIR